MYPYDEQLEKASTHTAQITFITGCAPKLDEEKTENIYQFKEN